MKEENKKIIQKICKKMEGERLYCLNVWEAMREDDYTIEVADQWLIGFLSEKDTLVKCFGEEEVEVNEHYSEQGYLVNSDKIPAWQYHAQQMIGMDLDERLKYFEEKYPEATERHVHKSDGTACLVAHADHRQCSYCKTCRAWY